MFTQKITLINKFYKCFVVFKYSLEFSESLFCSMENRKRKKENWKSSEGFAPLGAKNSWLIAAGQDHRCIQSSWLAGGAHDPDWVLGHCLKQMWAFITTKGPILHQSPGSACNFLSFFCKLFSSIILLLLFFFFKLRLIYSFIRYFFQLCCTAPCGDVATVWTPNPPYLTTVKPLI